MAAPGSPPSSDPPLFNGSPDRLLDSISDRFYLLARSPFMGRSRDEDLRPRLRSFPVGEYIIIYRIEGDGVAIVHVVHGSRNIQALLA